MSFRRKFLRQRLRIGGKPWSATRERAWNRQREETEREMIARAERIAAERLRPKPKPTWLGRLADVFRRRQTRRVS